MKSNSEVISYFRECLRHYFAGEDGSLEVCVNATTLYAAVIYLTQLEPVYPTEKYRAYWCGACDSVLVGDPESHKLFYRYCPKCGRKVKWDEKQEGQDEK